VGFYFYTSTKNLRNSPRFLGKILFDLIGTSFLLIITQNILTSKAMRNLLYVIAVILIIGWLLGVFAYSVGGVIHILLVLAVVSILLSLIRRGV
jgi:type III secretory pathway component EscU